MKLFFFGALLWLSASAMGQATGSGEKTAQPTQVAEVAKVSLVLGDKAPSLSINKWVKGEAVSGFETGKVYVVEFWATWCPPCRKSIPHLTELQKRFKDKGVTVIGVASSERRGLSDVEPFVVKQGEKMSYTVAWDDQERTNKTWMDASGQQGIPTAFIVNQEGRIAWIGHPMDGLEETLGAVVGKTFDLEKAASAARRRVELDAKSQPLIDKANAAYEAGNRTQAVAYIDQIIALDPAQQGNWVFHKFQLLAIDMGEFDKAYAYAAQVTDGIMRENASVLNSMAWTIMDAPTLGRRDLALAKRMAERANTLSGGKDPGMMDTYARALFETGDVENAVKVQTAAVAAAPVGDIRDDLQGRLDEYKKKAGKP